MNWIGVAVCASVLLVLVSTFRSRRELRAWLGADPLAWRRWLRALCFVAAALLVGRALGIAATEPPRLTGAGADVVLLVDVSRSMDARDTAPSRLRRAIRSAENIVEEARAVRLGLVVFAGEAFVALPLTQDRDAVLTYVRALDSDTVSVRGSDLQRGLEVAARTFDPRSDRPRTLILFSDGEHSGGSVEAEVNHLKSEGIRVVAVGYGQLEGALVPLPGGGNLEDDGGANVRSHRDDARLRRIAAQTGGIYLREWEDRPGTDRLLPPPEQRERSEAPPERDPLQWLLAAAALALAAELWISSHTLRNARRRAHPVALTSLLALTLLGFGAGDWLDEGDRKLEGDDAQEALSLYRRYERSRGSTPPTRVRVGNAQYRLGRLDQAATAYLDALRLVDSDDDAARFAASFNLGNTLLERERYREAYDAFWTAVVSNPDSLEAKFNYEWAAEHIEPEPPIPDLPPNPQESPQDSESESESSSSGSSGRGQAQARNSGGFSQSDAERWMQSIEETVSETLQRQITREYDGRPRGRRGGQTW